MAGSFNDNPLGARQLCAHQAVPGPGQILAPVYNLWAAGQPDTDPNGDADCAVMENGTGEWADEECSTSMAYVCEHEWD